VTRHDQIKIIQIDRETLRFNMRHFDLVHSKSATLSQLVLDIYWTSFAPRG
jgi:hypothetical protein